MMGKHHAIFASACYVAAQSAAVGAGAMAEPRAGQTLVGAVVAMGAALVPDLDEPRASASQSLGLVGRPVSRLIANLSGGHRGATHTLVAAALATFATSVASSHATAIALLIGVLVALGLDVLHWMKPEGVEWLIGAAVAAGAASIVQPGDVWPALAVAVGWGSHLVGDILTPRGVPLLWPLRPLDETVSVGLFRAGSMVEPAVTWGLVGGLVWLSQA